MQHCVSFKLILKICFIHCKLWSNPLIVSSKNKLLKPVVGSCKEGLCPVGCKQEHRGPITMQIEPLNIPSPLLLVVIIPVSTIAESSSAPSDYNGTGRAMSIVIRLWPYSAVHNQLLLHDPHYIGPLSDPAPSLPRTTLCFNPTYHGRSCTHCCHPIYQKIHVHKSLNYV